MRLLILFSLLFINNALGQSYQIVIDKDSHGNIITCSDSTKRYIYKEFDLNIDVKYSIEIYEDSISYLRRIKNGEVLEKDIFDYYTTLHSDLSCEIGYPNFRIEDFNRDGHNDLIVIRNTNMNGNQWSRIFLFNPISQSLQEIYSAEDDSIWAAPEFNPIDSTITCFQLSGIYGVSYKSTYKLNALTPIPIIKEESNSLSIDPRTGKGFRHYTYKGDKRKWKLIKTRKYRLEGE